MPGERNLISWVLRWRTNIYLVIQWLLLMHSYQWGQGTFVVFSHSDPANTHFVSVWAADHRWGTYHNLPGLSPPAVSVCVGLCQYHRRHPACPGAELPSPQVNLHTYTHTHTSSLWILLCTLSPSAISLECNVFYLISRMIDSLDPGSQDTPCF